MVWHPLLPPQQKISSLFIINLFLTSVAFGAKHATLLTTRTNPWKTRNGIKQRGHSTKQNIRIKGSDGGDCMQMKKYLAACNITVIHNYEQEEKTFIFWIFFPLLFKKFLGLRCLRVSLAALALADLYWRSLKFNYFWQILFKTIVICRISLFITKKEQWIQS